MIYTIMNPDFTHTQEKSTKQIAFLKIFRHNKNDKIELKSSLI